ncbi:hypothetical protein KDH83_28545 [Achromobacter sp. Marseille-Q0513]|uniref:hypothetical protein n=1 Tax=Achromobacter sp. Marseille-Q0513 TaxID=2829161 RepID=UPI001B9FBB86|nr:hypothetical protein [Achromobacter sp. Marseille-Q0513]MBR8657272.1 hypothetical protein [Achromobacter sp. Marseille-Q0513]
MSHVQHSPSRPDLGGIHLVPTDAAQAGAARQQLEAFLARSRLRDITICTDLDGAAPGCRASLAPAFAAQHLPDHDTTGLAQSLGLDSGVDEAALEREILLAMLGSPVPFPFPSVPELESAIRIRRRIVQAARKTALAFDTEHAERPEGYWTYDEERGFTILPGRSLIEGLRRATQPEASGQLYAFSCYRATEYVTVLGIAQELEQANPALARDLQRQWETRAVMSGRFHDTFLHEYGSLAEPLPQRFYVPGDRLWFRNPDSASSDVEGYEGSWVFYLGGGLFNNFWERDQPFTLTSKCVEIHHWQHALRADAQGKGYIDEERVKTLVRQTLADPDATAAVLARMMRIRDPQGVYEEGGCIDATRERVRWVTPGHSDISLPDFPSPAPTSVA